MYCTKHMRMVIDPKLTIHVEGNVLEPLKERCAILTKKNEFLIEQPFVEIIDNTVGSPIRIIALHHSALFGIERNSLSIQAFSDVLDPFHLPMCRNLV